MTRIIGGSVGGRRLKTLPGTGTRPTSDRVREALFSAIESQLGTLAGRVVVDLYAGSGAVGLEARSRGARAVTLVERDRAAAELIRANARALGLDGVHIVTNSAERWAAQPSRGGGFDVAFLDPPYSVADDTVTDVLRLLVQNGWLVEEPSSYSNAPAVTPAGGGQLVGKVFVHADTERPCSGTVARSDQDRHALHESGARSA